MDHKKLAKELVSRASGKIEKVVVFGSNYLMFDGLVYDCSKCVVPKRDQMVEPTLIDVFTFITSLEMHTLFRIQNVPGRILIMPSDLPKGVRKSKLAKIRSSYTLPCAFDVHLNQANTWYLEEDRLFMFESELLPTSTIQLNKIASGETSLVPYEDSDRQVISVSTTNYPSAPIGKRVGNKLVPLCQLLMADLYERMANQGVTHFFGLVRSDSMICAKQGTEVAMELGKLGRMHVQLSAFRFISNGNLEMTDLRNYDPAEREG